MNKVEEWDKSVPREFHLKSYSSGIQSILVGCRRWEREGWKFVMVAKLQELWSVETIIAIKFS